MIWGSEFQNREPLFWIGGRPVYATVVLIVAYCIGMVFVALSQSVSGDGIWLNLVFSSEAFWAGKWWQIFTYPLMNYPSLWFGVEMVMLYWFGSELEKYLGRRMFFIFYGLLWLVPVWVLAVGGAWLGGVVYHGSGVLNFCVFTAFAMIYPRVELIFTLQARWLACGIGGLWVLSMFAKRAWIDLAFFVASVLLVWMILRWNWESFFFSVRTWLESKFNRPRVRRLAKQKATGKIITGRKINDRVSADVALRKKEEEVDLILDKIAAHGLDSLSPAERKLLEEHSAALSKGD
ncbi:MAG: rhomboid family intramembrane serine protease [Methylacidiphilales bacterium]|nr:rhomboid family intramembrane serine protease [Candidatus Methylacidiphilales bacterium]MDW8348899.1 hypothetical protein [Verrucomicrobiae bacterium]